MPRVAQAPKTSGRDVFTRGNLGGQERLHHRGTHGRVIVGGFMRLCSRAIIPCRPEASPLDSSLRPSVAALGCRSNAGFWGNPHFSVGVSRIAHRSIAETRMGATGVFCTKFSQVPNARDRMDVISQFSCTFGTQLGLRPSRATHFSMRIGYKMAKNVCPPICIVFRRGLENSAPACRQAGFDAVRRMIFDKCNAPTEIFLSFRNIE